VNLLLEALLVLVTVGWARLAMRSRAAQRVLLLGLAAFVAHSIARHVAPFLYLPQRYVIYVVPLLVALLVPAAICGLLGPRRSGALQLVVRAAYTTILLAWLGGRVEPRAGLTVDLRSNAALYQFIARLPPTAVIAGWPNGPLDDIPYATRRAVLLSYELHQAFHRGYVTEARARMQALTAAYFSTSPEALLVLQQRWGVTHLLVDRRHLLGRTPGYFKPFDETIRRTLAAGRHQPFELLRQIPAAAVYNRGDLVLLELGRLLPPSPTQPPPVLPQQL
jgi:hypothetical protein